jgi:hypothetical protein
MRLKFYHTTYDGARFLCVKEGEKVGRGDYIGHDTRVIAEHERPVQSDQFLIYVTHGMLRTLWPQRRPT